MRFLAGALAVLVIATGTGCASGHMDSVDSTSSGIEFGSDKEESDSTPPPALALGDFTATYSLRCESELLAEIQTSNRNFPRTTISKVAINGHNQPIPARLNGIHEILNAIRSVNAGCAPDNSLAIINVFVYTTISELSELGLSFRFEKSIAELDHITCRLATEVERPDLDESYGFCDSILNAHDPMSSQSTGKRDG